MESAKIDQAKAVELVRRHQAGDKTAMDKLMRLIQKRVYYKCLKMLQHEQDAEDTAQDILLTVAQKLDGLREPVAFPGWLAKIVNSRCANKAKRKKPEYQFLEDEEGNSMLDSLEQEDRQLVPDAVIDNRETQRMVIELVEKLPEEQRMSVLMHYYDELPIKDIAEAMGVPEGTVKSRLNYARKSLKGGVEDYEKQGIKLYGMSPLPFLMYFLQKDALGTALSETAAESLISSALAGGAAAAGTAAASAAGTAAGAVGGEVAAAAAGTTAAGTVAAASGAAGAASGGVLGGLSAKIVAGVLAGTLAVGGVSAGVSHFATKSDMQREIDELTRQQVQLEERLDLSQEQARIAQAEAEELRHDSLEDAFALLDTYMAEEKEAEREDIIVGALEKAESLARAGDYDWALRVIGIALEHYPDDERLLEALALYEAERPVWLLDISERNGLRYTWAAATSEVGTVYATEHTATIPAESVEDYIFVPLNGQYSTLTGTIGLVNVEGAESFRFEIIGDGTVLYERSYYPESIEQSIWAGIDETEAFFAEEDWLPIDLSLDISGVQALAVKFYGLGDGALYVPENVVVSWVPFRAYMALVDLELHK